MKRLLFILFICFSNTVFCQNFYEVKWTLDGINYTALIEYFTTENINVRVKYRINGNYRVAKFKSKGITFSSGDNFNIIGSDARIVYPRNYENPTAYITDHFYFTNKNHNNIYQDLFVYNLSDKNKVINRIKTKWKELNPYTDFSEKYLYSFFDKDESEYGKYLRMVSTSNSNYVSSNFTSTSTSSSSSGNYTHHKLKFKNNCSKEILTLIRFKNKEDEWETKGWWHIRPKETVYVEDTENGIFYFYAKSTDGSLIWSGKDNYKTFKNTKYGFKKLETNNSYGNWTTTISCSNQSDQISSSDNSSSLSSAIKVHLIFAADVEDPSIGYSTKQDMNDITNLFRKATKELNVKFKSYKIYGNYFDKSNLISTIDNLVIDNNDVIIFYYSGHGYNDTNSYNKFPNMSLDGPDLSLENIHNKLKYKNARLTLTIGDLCNSIPRMRNRTASQTEIPFKSGFLFDNRKLSNLLIKTKGSLISTSSKKGQWSFTMGNNSNGIFTNAFINSFTKEASKVSNNSGSWSNLFNNAYYEAKNKSSSTKNQDGNYGQSGVNTNNLKF